jgi:hypothetical protein
LQHKPVRLAAAVAGSILVVSAGSAAVHWAGAGSGPASPGQAYALNSLAGGAQRAAHGGQPPGPGPAASRSTAGLPRPESTGAAGRRPALPPAAKGARSGRAARQRSQSQQQAADAPAYRNPLRDISGLIPERIDMGVDFGGSGPVYALGDAVITNATGDSAGWPGGGWITYQLTGGPAAGLMVFVAEDVAPTVKVGQHVSSATVIASMFAGGDGIETGWAQPDGFSAESQLAEAGGISGNGPFPTVIGLNFEELLQSLGVPAANNRAGAAYGLLPANYRASWK